MSLDKYIYIKKIDEGYYGSMFHAEDRWTEEKVIINEYSNIDVGMKEATILQSLNCANIVALKDVVKTNNGVRLVLEFLDGILFDYIHIVGKMEPNLFQSYAYQLLCALAYLHDRNIINRDIRLSNILINKEGALKITNFESSCAINNQHLSPDFIAFWYCPLEMLLGSTSYDCSVDVWSAGCAIAKMLTGKELFLSESPQEQITAIFKLFGTPNEESYPGFSSLPRYSPDFPVFEKQDLASVFGTSNSKLIDLLSKLLEVDPSRRITARAALHHPFFDDINPKVIETFYPSEDNE